MYDSTNQSEEHADIMECAQAAEDAIRRLASITVRRPSMTPADIDVVLAQLAGAVAALPQAATQLGDMLEQAHEDLHLTMDGMTNADDPVIAIDTARLHLDAARAPAMELYRHLDAAHNQSAHSATDPLEQDAGEVTPRVLRPEHRQPPPGDGGHRPGISR